MEHAAVLKEGEMRKGRIAIITAGVVCIIPGILGVLIMINSLVKNLGDPPEDMTTSEILLDYFSEFFIIPTAILFLGILLIWKSNSEKWGLVFIVLGIIILVLASLMATLAIAFGVFGVLFLLAIPILMIVGGVLNRK